MASIIGKVAVRVKTVKMASGKNRDRELFYQSVIDAAVPALQEGGWFAFGLDEGESALTYRLGLNRFAAHSGMEFTYDRLGKGDREVRITGVKQVTPVARKPRGRKANPNKPVKPTRDPNAPPAKRGRPKKVAA